MSNPVQIFDQVLRERSKHLARLEEELRQGTRPIVLENLAGSALAFIMASMVRDIKRPLLILTAGRERAEDLAADMEFFGIRHAMQYPKWEVLPYDQEGIGLEITARTLDAIESITRHRNGGVPFVLTAPVDALMLRVLPSEVLQNLTLHIRWGDTINTVDLANRLDAAGYTREPLVEARGEYSIRGGIIDIFPLNAEHPYRIDLFGDDIESIRHFDEGTQRSLEDLGTGADILVPPAGLKEILNAHLAKGGKLQTLFDFLPDETLVLLESPERFQEVGTYFYSAVERQYEIAGKHRDDLCPVRDLVLDMEELQQNLTRFRRMEHSSHGHIIETPKALHVRFDNINYTGATMELESWLTQIKKFQMQEFLVVVVCDNDGQVLRFDELLREQEINAIPLLGKTSDPTLELKSILKGYQDVILMVGAVQTGFALPDARLLITTDREIFGRYKRRHVYKKIYKGKPIATSNEIRRNDYVVHVDHGIGRFLGMRVQEIDKRMVELIEILYADDNKLLVPVEKIHKVQKYSGPESAEPTLDKLGGGKWAKRREKNAAEIEKIANELLELYAQRQMATREPHIPDNNMIREFESAFLYQETPDQLQAINDAKKDMENTRPMDRLVCGDVGFGKTEVAIRTLFKCVQSGRQTAVLCPTTILAQQHFNNFKERFADFPVRIDMISRFRSPAEVKAVKKKLKEGELDIVVGTHGLLAKDIAFKNLGLVVVDEEQRFGVRAKERLKEMRAAVDFLTLSATPIPRTLHMALSGLRDLSLITTPPPDRQPIKTKIIHFEEEQIAEAILRELNRGGQVYFVHNRVMSIDEVVRRLKEIVPHARIIHAHGQMDPEQLEDTMIRFIDHQFDILVATTIIESGVDIPNCNTIIINRADAFGLAQLYQLRGRVGREKRRAYAYLVVPQGRAITEAAVKRLAAIEEFAELGVGFSIAMRDLEIRGAGDFLGSAQHGSISEIGFELYCELLEEKVRALKGEIAPLFFEVEIKWNASAYIPPPYVAIESQRVTFYKRLASARMESEIDEIESELHDRYGDLPETAQNLIASYRLRLACIPNGIGGAKHGGGKIRLTLSRPRARELEATFKQEAKAFPWIKGVLADTFDQILLTTEELETAAPAMLRLRDYLLASTPAISEKSNQLNNSK